VNGFCEEMTGSLGQRAGQRREAEQNYWARGKEKPGRSDAGRYRIRCAYQKGEGWGLSAGKGTFLAGYSGAKYSRKITMSKVPGRIGRESGRAYLLPGPSVPEGEEKQESHWIQVSATLRAEREKGMETGWEGRRPIPFAGHRSSQDGRQTALKRKLTENNKEGGERDLCRVLTRGQGGRDFPDYGGSKRVTHSNTARIKLQILMSRDWNSQQIRDVSRG